MIIEMTDGGIRFAFGCSQTGKRLSFRTCLCACLAVLGKSAAGLFELRVAEHHLHAVFRA